MVNLYEIKPIKDRAELNLSYSKELEVINEIENYYPDEKKGLIIYKNKSNFKIKFKRKIIKEFKGLYNYDNISGTLIVYKKKKKLNKKLLEYFLVMEIVKHYIVMIYFLIIQQLIKLC